MRSAKHQHLRPSASQVQHFGITVAYCLSCSRPYRGQFREKLLEIGAAESPAERARHGLVAVLKGEQIMLQGAHGLAAIRPLDENAECSADYGPHQVKFAASLYLRTPPFREQPSTCKNRRPPQFSDLFSVVESLRFE